MDCNYFDKSNEQINKANKKTNYSFYSPGWQTEMRAELSSLWDFGRRFAQHDQVGLGIINIVMIIIIRVEVDEIENIQKEVENDAIDLDSVAERWFLMTWDDVIEWYDDANDCLSRTIPATLIQQKLHPCDYMWLLLDLFTFSIKSQLSRSMPSMPGMEEETRLSWKRNWWRKRTLILDPLYLILQP